ncbi:lysophospholipid acyltransferase family protein [Patiriisocius hiemis]|uniref:Lysophospholipid acyltransferase family protein n=1 Tax=Patiriisocius hiemis TaxID=3075604 RepID=A0ABU2YEK1_9FLAO|nr:lysophospholipid acyltransferase family protein [Constantimarinum sp. W242]MDT0556624.1 lysophospholipid acyltransferase family protein [Constantimarinum sp. W242]
MQRLLYIIIYPALWFTSVLPMSILYIKSSVLYQLTYHIFGYRKKVVFENLKLAFPSKTEAERTQIAKGFYKHLCDLIFETIKSLTISENQIRKRFTIENIELLEKLYNNNRSILLMAGHYGNWEWSGIVNKMMQHQGFAVYKPLDNKQFDSLVKKIRSRFGATIVPNTRITKVLYRYKKEETTTLTYILSDQTPRPDAFKHREDFMGINVPVFTGTEELAKLLDFTLLYFKVEKVKRGYYKATFVPVSENPKEDTDYKNTRKFLDLLEAQIKEEPAYYLWSHKRWKHRGK